MKEYIESLNWRYATKKYDPARKVSDKDIETLKDAVQLSVSAMGLQPYKILIIDNPEVRIKLKEVGNNQDSIINASHLFVFATETNLGPEHVGTYIDNISKVRQVTKDTLAPFENAINGYIKQQSGESIKNWASKQAYIALSTLINTAALLKIDATPMEGFSAAGFDDVLELDKLGLTAAVIATVGYRHSDDPFQHLKKVRKPKEELFITV